MYPPKITGSWVPLKVQRTRLDEPLQTGTDDAHYSVFISPPMNYADECNNYYYM